MLAVETGGLQDLVLGQYIKCFLFHVQPVVQRRMQGSAFVCPPDKVCTKWWWIFVIFRMGVMDITPLEAVSLFLCLIWRYTREDVVHTSEVAATPASFKVGSWNFVWYSWKSVHWCVLRQAVTRAFVYNTCVQKLDLRSAFRLQKLVRDVRYACEISYWGRSLMQRQILYEPTTSYIPVWKIKCAVDTYLLIYLLTYLLTHLLTHSLTYSLTHSLHCAESFLSNWLVCS